MADQNRPPIKRTLAAVIGASAAGLLISITSSSEGVALTPYDDALAGHVETVCFGETHVTMRPYTLSECKDMLSGSLAGYAEAVRASTPGFDTLTDGQKAASVDMAYNTGVANYKGSTLRKRYIAKQFPAACEQFLRWRFVNHGKTDCSIAANKCGGIYKRRLLERSACRGEKL